MLKSPPGRPKGLAWDGSYETLGDSELPAHEAEEADRLIGWAEEDLAAAGRIEARVNMRWTKAQLAVIRRAAALVGVPYQSYLKQVALERAMQDLGAARQAGLISDDAPQPAPEPEGETRSRRYEQAFSG